MRSQSPLASLLPAMALAALMPGCQLLPPYVPEAAEGQEPSALRGRVGTGLETENPILVYLVPVATRSSPGREDAAGDAARVAPRTVMLRRRGGLLEPRFVLTSVGRPLVFSNQDDVHHSIFSSSDRNAFELGVLAVGEAQRISFPAQGEVPFYCSLHEGEHGLIFVTPSEHIAVADGRGHYSLTDVPPGRYRLRAWSDANAHFDREITLRPGESAWRAIELEAGPDSE